VSKPITDELRKWVDKYLYPYSADYIQRSYGAALAEFADQIDAEHEKLRDAVVALWKCCAWNTNLCEWCDECDLHDTENGGCKLKRMLNELGIEVQ